jgi:hypothetical protein
MISPVVAVCGDPECPNNASAKQTLCCAACGRCADHSHQDCGQTVSGNTVSYHGRQDQ